jgi:hypothetical protein
MSKRYISITVLASLVPACAAKYSPKRSTPEPTMPTIDLASVPPVVDKGQVVLDSVDGAASVREILSTSSFHGTHVHAWGQQTAPICTTPCVANLSYGPHMLEFAHSHEDSYQATINVTTKPTVYRVAPGKFVTHPGGTIAGLTMLIFGGIAGMLGVAIGATTDNTALIGVGIGGAVLGGAGGFILSSSRNEITPGAMTQFPVP